MLLVAQPRCSSGNIGVTHVKKEEQSKVKIFVVKTTTGQERNVARLIASKVEMTHIPIKALLIPDTLKGYVFIEADGPHLVEEAISGVRHVRSRI
jgi:transcriptional antiterminator NusG